MLTDDEILPKLMPGDQKAYERRMKLLSSMLGPECRLNTKARLVNVVLSVSTYPLPGHQLLSVVVFDHITRTDDDCKCLLEQSYFDDVLRELEQRSIGRPTRMAYKPAESFLRCAADATRHLGERLTMPCGKRFIEPDQHWHIMSSFVERLECALHPGPDVSKLLAGGPRDATTRAEYQGRGLEVW